jgi:hypothetical protein
MAGDYPSSDFAVSEDGVVRRVVHVPSGMTIATTRVPQDPLAVSSRYTIETEGIGAHYPQEIAQTAMRHLRVWVMRKYGQRRRGLRGAHGPRKICRGPMRNRTRWVYYLRGRTASGHLPAEAGYPGASR